MNPEPPGVTPPPPPPPPPPEGETVSQQEWQAFIGKNSDAYLAKFPRFMLAGRETFTATWHWPAFLAGSWWFLYRKLYLWFALGLVGLFVPYLRWLVWIGGAIAANYLYFIEAKKQITQIKAQFPPEEWPQRLAQAGGVHAWVPWVAVLACLLYLVFLLVAVLFLGGLTLGVLLGLGHQLR